MNSFLSISYLTSFSPILLSSSTNIGIITVKYILKKILNKFNKLSNDNKKKYINNYEGFIRQIIGWRSYIRYIYVYHTKNLINENFFNNNNKLNNNIWYKNKKSTNIPIIDNMINKVFKYAYLHHIERLMLIGNYFLLTFIKPIYVYEWFTSMFIDSYEYIMVANILIFIIYFSLGSRDLSKLLINNGVSLYKNIFCVYFK